LLAILSVSLLAIACGKKGPPLPPLVLLPNAPADFTAIRRDERVDLTFRVPNANTDRSTPADLRRIDLYAWTVPGPVSADEVVRRGTRVGTVAVNKPKDPDEPEPETPAPKGDGVDQNEVATISETVPADADPSAYRVYVAVGFNQRGRRGALSPRIAVPLVAPPPAPGEPAVKYDEKTITVSWAPPDDADAQKYKYAVYTPDVAAPLTAAPVAEARFTEDTGEWETERCYEVRTVATIDRVRVESAPSDEHCVTLHDTFAPASPEGLVGVGSEGAISLIWTPNREADLAGYLVLRAIEPSTDLVPITRTPISDTNFRDTVASGARVTYAVQAVDKAGNRSAPSASITESAR
jgi:hypothetical protein